MDLAKAAETPQLHTDPVDEPMEESQPEESNPHEPVKDDDITGPETRSSCENTE